MALATGLDIGHHTVRAIVLERKGTTLRIRSFGEASRFNGEGEPKPLAAVIAELDAKVGFKGQVVCSNNDMNVLVRFVTTLPMPPDRLARILRLELAQNADASGDLAADTIVVPLPSDEVLQCCILAQPTQVYTALIDLRDAAVSDPKVHFAPAAVYNTTLPIPLVRDNDVALFIDIGSHTTGVTLFGDDRFLACRQINTGGDQFTEALVAGGMNRHAAENSKRQGQAAPAVASTEIDEFNQMLDDTVADEPPPSASAPGTPAPAAVAPGVSAPAAPAAAHYPVLQPSFDDEPADPQGDEVPDLFGDTPASPVVIPAAPATPPAAAPRSATSDSHELFIIDDNPSSSMIPPQSEPVAAPSVPSAPQPAVTPPVRPTVAAPAPAATTSAASAAPGEGALDPALTRSAEALYGQIVSSLVWFKAQLKVRALDPKLIVLAGAGAAVPGLAGYLSRRFSAPTQFSDPFASIEEGLKPERAHEWAAAMGLALAAPSIRQRSAVRIDLRPETLIKRALWRSRLIWPYVAAACLVVGAIFMILTLHASYAAQQSEIDAYAAYQASYDADKKQLDTLDAQKADLQTDLRAIASRIYAGRDILYTLVALKERTRDSPQLWVTSLATHSVGKDTDMKDEMARQGDVIRERGDPNLTIDRGAVDISGKVKFESAATYEGRNEFVHDWRFAILVASPDGRYPLFHDAKETRNEQSDQDAENAKVKGEYSWGARFFFEPTQLSQIQATTAMPPGVNGHPVSTPQAGP